MQTYLERDVSLIVRVRDKLLFTTFLQAVAARTGQLLNFDNLADELGMSAATARAWLSVLEASGVVFLLRPFSNSALNRAVKTPKLYFRDTGLACFLTRWDSPETARAGAMAGALFETFVVNEIVKSYAAAGMDYRFHLRYYRGKGRLRRQGKSVERRPARPWRHRLPVPRGPVFGAGFARPAAVVVVGKGRIAQAAIFLHILTNFYTGPKRRKPAHASK